MRQKKNSKRIIAWLTCMVMAVTSLPVNVLAAAGQTDLPAADGGTGGGELNDENTAGQQGNEGEEATPTVTPPQEILEEEPAPEPMAQEEEPDLPEQVFWDARVSVSWADEGNLAGRRYADGQIPFSVYADGALMEEQPVIRKLEQEPEERFGVETETYVIERLPRYQEDMVSAITYTVKEMNTPESYREMETGSFVGGDASETASWLESIASPQEEVALEANDSGDGFRGTKTFGNYLPSYQVEGTLTWQDDHNSLGARPDPEAYFARQFAVLLDGQPYEDCHISYARDEEDDALWHYGITGLFTTRRDGSPAAYQIQAQETEGYSCETRELTVEEDLPAADFLYVGKAPVVTETVTPTPLPVPSLEAGNGDSMSAGQAPVMLEAVPEREKNGEETAVYSYGAYDQTAEAVSEYRDNHDEKAQRPGTDVRTAAMKPYFSLSVGGVTTEYPLTDAGWTRAKNDLKGKGFDVAGLSMPTPLAGNLTVTEESRGTNSYRYSVSGLPGEILQDGGKIAGIAYALKEECGDEFDGYINETGDDQVYYHHIKTEFKADINLRDGNQAFLAEDYLDTLLGELTLTGKGTDGSSVNLALSDFVGDGSGVYTYNGYTLQITKTSQEGGKNAALKISVAGLPLYTRGDEETIWKLTAGDLQIAAEDMTGNPGDFYGILYDNGDVPNFGSVTDTCHNGGTITCTLEGTENYKADKYWLDEYTGSETADALEQKAKRPEITFYLWRYAAQPGADYTQAAQVKDESGSYMVYHWNKDHNQTEDTFEIAFASLPKYDPEGYPYVYLLRENMGSSDLGIYEQVYGKVNEADGSITDDKDPMGGDFAEGGRGFDQSVYNGGAISNRITGTTPVQWKKTWKAAYHQNDLKDVAVTLTLQSRPKGSTESFAPAVPAAEVVVDSFIAERLTQSGSISAPAYDYLGRPLEYCFAESRITENGVEVTPDEKGRYRFTHNQTAIEASVQGANDIPDDEYYTSVSKVEGDLTTVTNELKGTTTYTVDKLWKVGDDYVKDAPEGAAAQIQLRQDNELYAGGAAELNRENNYYYQYTELPKFDENGILHTYVVDECASSNNWHPSYEYNVYDPDETADPHNHYDAQIKNDPVGPGTVIKLRKIWLDDGDEQHRENVTVDVYRKARDGETEDKKLGSYTLNAAHGWWGEFGIPDDEAGGEYYIVERMVGDKPVVYARENPGMAGEGLVQGRHHNYIVKNLGLVDGYYTVSNRRTGTVNMTVTKKWVDGNNEKNERGNPQLQLVWQDEGNGAEVTVSDTGAADTVSVTDGDSFFIEDNTGGLVASKQQVQTTENESKYYFYNLPKYDDKGRIIHYGVEEIKYGMGADYSVTIEQSSYQQSGVQFSGDDQQIAVTNQKTGSRNVVFKKKWHDKYVNEVLNKRPDIYLELYQSSDNSAPALISEYKDRNWVVESGDDDYHWTCVFPHMPKYDGEGYEITYYGEEKSLVDRTKLDYLVEADSVYRYEITGTDGTKKQEYPKNVTAKTEDDREVLKEYLADGSSDGTFINAIGAPVDINGKKVWKSVPDGTPFADLPEITVHVDQTLKSGGIGPKKIYSNPLTGELPKPRSMGSLLDAADPNLKLDVVTPYTIQKDDGKDGVYSFHFDVGKDTGKHLPKYNEDGQIYTYIVRETAANASALGSTAYEALPGEVSNYIITNTYETSNRKNSGKLEVKKTWSGIGEEDLNGKYQYPAVDFILYRQYQSKDSGLNVDNGYTQAEKVAEIRAASKPGKDGAEAEAVFENLRIYAPNGAFYSYYVEEKTVNGYETVSAVSAKVTLSVENTGADKDTYERQNEVSFSNTYKPEANKVRLVMEKNWKDYGNALGTRPDVDSPGTLEVFKTLFRAERYANAQDGEYGAPAVAGEDITGQLQTSDSAAGFYLTMTEDGDRWEITIANLEQYAPNSMPWRYKITEKSVPEGYENGGTVSDTTEEASAGNGGAVKLKAMTNSSLKSASVEKKWTGMENEYGLRPTSVTVKLQVKPEDGSWTDIDDGSAFGAVQGTEIFNKICGANGGVTGLSSNEIKLTGTGNQWSKVTVKDLPAYKMEGNALKAYSYRFVETKIGEVAVVTDGSADPVVYPKTGVYEPQQTVTAGTSFGTDKTVVTNHVENEDTVALKVKKAWTDSEDAYDTRPSEIKVLLQRKEKNNPAAAWENVTKYGTSDLVYETISVNGTIHEETFADLPAQSYDGLTKYEYRAVETDASGTSGEKIGGYKVSADDSGENESDITNTLDPTGEVRARKYWKTGAEADKGTVYLELQYKVTGEDRWKQFSTRQIVALDGTVDTGSSRYEEAAWEAVWTGVPVTGRSYRVVELTGNNGTALEAQETLSIGEKSYFVTYIYPDGAGPESGVTIQNSETAFSVVNTEQTSHPVKKEWGQTDLAYKSDLPDSVTFRLYRTTDETAVGSEAGTSDVEEVLDAQNAPVELTLSRLAGASWNQNWTGTFDKLPKYDEKKNSGADSIGKTDLYYYFAKEIKINGRDLTDPENRAWRPVPAYGLDTEAQAGGSTWVNTMEVTELTGQKQWSEDAPEYRPDSEDMKLTLYRKSEGGEEKEVTAGMLESGAVPSPEWSGTDGDLWTYTYKNLPKYDKTGKEYSYAVKETQADGYQEPSYEDGGGSAADSDTITNTVTAITLDKVDENGGPINGVELEIRTGNAVAATWSRSADGSISGGLEGKTALTDGRILGLKANTTYTVHEKVTPDGYLTPADSTFTTDGNGKIAEADKNLEIAENGLKLKVKNTKILGSVTLEKYLKAESGGQKEKLPGAKFQLYIQKGPDQNLNEDSLYSEDVYTAGSDGTVKVSDLPKGAYYFRETGATADSKLNEQLTSQSFTIDGKTAGSNANAVQPDPITVEVENEIFSASVNFVKGDAENENQPITSGITFMLSYTPAEPAGLVQPYSDRTAEVAADGTVIFENLQKGTYILREQKPVGYEGGFSCEFVIGDEDEGENTLEKLVNRTTGSVTGGSMSGNIVLNHRETGAVCIQKISAPDGQNPGISLDGAEFRMKKTDDPNWSWNDTVFVSGKSYELKESGFEEIQDPSSGLGIIMIQGLPWGTYSLKETKAPAGYQVEDSQEVPFTIDRKHLDLTAVTDDRQVTNVQNSVTLVKRDKDEPDVFLPGAVYRLEGKFRQPDGTAGTETEIRNNLVTGADGTLALTGQLIGGETYQLTEVQAPMGYELPDNPTILFTVNAYGTVSVGEEPAEEQKVGLSDDKISLQLKKYGAATQGEQELKGDALEGMCFSVSGTFASADHTATETITGRRVTFRKDPFSGKEQLDLSEFDGRWLATTGSGENAEEGVNKFTYTITEITPPAGYELPAAPAAAFTVDRNGTITLEGDHGAYEVEKSSGDTLRVTDIPVEVSLKKTDMQGTVIDAAQRGEAEFAVEPAVNGTYFADGTTAKLEGTASELAGKLTAQLTADGSTQYRLTETKAPAGYVLESPALTLTFTVSSDGTFQFAESDRFAGNGTAQVEIRNAPICLSLVKTDISDSTDAPVNDRGTALFEVKPKQEDGAFADGSKEKITVSAEADGMSALDGMVIPGVKYILEEIAAPEGYELAAAVTFSVNEQGKVTVENSGPGEADASADGTGLIIRDRKIQIGLLKVSSETFGGENTSILDGGCIFEVTPLQGSRFTDGSEKITLKQGNMEALDGQLIAGHSYGVHEVTAPKGYELAEDFTFLVQPDGTAADLKKADQSSAGSYVGVKEETAEDSGETGRIQIVVADEPITMGFVKRLEGDLVTEGMEGAEFTLTGKLADGSEEISWTSGTLPYELKALLTAGETYTLTETKAPEGAVPVTADTKSAFTFKFTVDEHGNITGEQGSVTWSGEDEILTVNDQPIALKIFKKGADNEGRPDDPLLTLCSFQITGRFAAARYSRTREISQAGVQTLTVTTNGSDTEDNVLKGRLIVGETYTIKEIAPPNGYELGGQITFTVSGVRVDQSGKARAVLEMAETDEGKGYVIGYDEDGYPVILQRDEPVIMKLKKTDMNGQTLAGAEFTVTGVFGSDEKESAKTFTSDGKGMAELANILNESSDLSGTEYVYKLEETKAPEGYEKVEEAIYFRLMSAQDKDGSRSAKAEILYGDGRTSDGVKAHVSVSEEDGVQTLQIKDKEQEKAPEKKPESGGSGTGNLQTPQPTQPAADVQGAQNVKTGDQNGTGNWLALMLAAMGICLLLKRKQFKAKK